jgi:elongation factor G
VRGVLETGFVAGYPLQDVRVIVYDGKHHAVDSKDVAFASAGRKAFLDALAKARPIILEPIVNVQIVAPEGKMGDIAGELSGHRGQIKGSIRRVPARCRLARRRRSPSSSISPRG